MEDIDKGALGSTSEDFTLGHKLDIAQIDYFYRNEFAFLYTSRGMS